MSRPDPYRAYKIGAIRNQLLLAEEALSNAFVQASTLENEADEEVRSALSRAVTEVKAARRIDINWNVVAASGDQDPGATHG